MATINLGTIGFTYRGVYDAATTYSKQDIVKEGSDTYVSLVDSNTGTTPGTDPTKWEVFTAGIGQGTGTPAGGIWYYDGSGVQVAAPTDANQVLRIDETTNLPVWTADDQRSGQRVANLPFPMTNTYRFGFCIMENGSWRSWGYNGYGQQGHGAQTGSRNMPTNAIFPKDFVGIKLSKRKLVNRNKKTVTLAVTQGTDGGGNPIFIIDGVDNPNIDMTNGNIYKFDQTDSTNTEDLVFEESTDGGTTWASLTIADIGDRLKTSVYTAPGLTVGTDRVTYIRIGDNETNMYRYVGSTTGSAMGNTITLNKNGFVYDYEDKGWYFMASYQVDSAIIDNDGKLWTWGRNNVGECGTGGTSVQYFPYCASDNASNSINGKNLIKIANMPANGTSTQGILVLADDGTIHYAGDGGYGLPANSSTTDQYNFVQANVQLGIYQTGSLNSFVDVWGGNTEAGFAIALGKDGTLYHTGYTGHYTKGTIANTTQNNTYTAITNVTVPVAEILCVVPRGVWVRDINGDCWNWGWDNNSSYAGALGRGSYSYFDPAIVFTNTANGDNSVCEVIHTAYSDNYMSSLVRTASGHLHSSGYNGYGGCLDGSTSVRNTFHNITTYAPTVVYPGDHEPTGYPSFPTNIKRMVISGNASAHTFLCLTDDGEVLAWGYNGHGQNGSGVTTNHSASGQYMCVPIPKEVIDIGAWGYGSEETCAALTEDGTMYTWGYSADGSIGNDNQYRYGPVSLIF